MKHLVEEIIATDKEIALQLILTRIDFYLEFGEDPEYPLADLMRLYLEYYD